MPASEPTEDLAAALERAAQGSRELDGRIWCDARGLAFVAWDGAGCVYRTPASAVDRKALRHVAADRVARFTDSLDAALLGERIVKVSRYPVEGGRFFAVAWNGVTGRDSLFCTAEAATEPLARRAAHLRVLATAAAREQAGREQAAS